MSHKVKFDGELLEQAKQCAEVSGYASLDEFVLHTVEKEVKRMLSPGQGDNLSKEQITKQLKGLGYIE